jgi:hypothetical protein
MNRLTAAVESEIALIRRALYEATHNRVTARIAAMSNGLARIFRAAPTPPVQAEHRPAGSYVWDARGYLVPLQKGGATHSGPYDIISPAPGIRGSEISRQHRIG